MYTGEEFRRKRHHLENQGIDGWIVLTSTCNIRNGEEGQCLDQSDLTQDKESWQSIVNVVMYFWF